MKPYERVFAAINLEEPDKVPVVPQITYTTARLIGIKFSEAMRNAKTLAKALIAGYTSFRYDGVYVGWESSFNVLAEAMGCKLREYDDSLPSVSEPLIKDESDLSRMKVPNPQTDGRLPVHIDALKMVNERVGREAAILSWTPGPLTFAGILRGTEKLLIDLLTNRKFVHEILKVATSSSTQFALAKLDAGAQIIAVADPTASSSVISPKTFEEFSYPYLSIILSSIRKHGGTPSLHICGNTVPILERMSETGAEILELDSVVDLATAKRTVGRKVCLQGNIDTTRMLMGSPSEVFMQARKCIDATGEGGGFILSSGCEIPLDAPHENVKSMVEAARRYGGYG